MVWIPRYTSNHQFNMGGLKYIYRIHIYVYIKIMFILLYLHTHTYNIFRIFFPKCGTLHCRVCAPQRVYLCLQIFVCIFSWSFPAVLSLMLVTSHQNLRVSIPPLFHYHRCLRGRLSVTGISSTVSSTLCLRQRKKLLRRNYVTLEITANIWDILWQQKAKFQMWSCDSPTRCVQRRQHWSLVRNALEMYWSPCPWSETPDGHGEGLWAQARGMVPPACLLRGPLSTGGLSQAWPRYSVLTPELL